MTIRHNTWDGLQQLRGFNANAKPSNVHLLVGPIPWVSIDTKTVFVSQPGCLAELSYKDAKDDAPNTSLNSLRRFGIILILLKRYNNNNKE